ncbi:unnamed protein product [Mytilus coruscus]|uniref:MEGF10_11 n=1 Tax=Mytilus coruscus TaxID=42192 RepID=A0A6J8DNB3_MYTCO|nr:unnamed protein product [Mytilus coruscus]
MNDFRLYLVNTTIGGHGEILCYTDLGIPGYPNTTQDIECYIVAKKLFYLNRHKAVELCYIAVNGCWKGTWGTNCTTDCPGECTDRHCYPENGSCVWGCVAQKCFHGRCDAKTDVCTQGCVPGRGGRYCTFCRKDGKDRIVINSGDTGVLVLAVNFYLMLKMTKLRNNTVYNGTAKQSMSGHILPATVLVDGTSLLASVYYRTVRDRICRLDMNHRNPTVGNHKVYCSNTSDSWGDGIMLYNAEYVNEDIDVFAVCKYIIYIPPILNGNAKIDICEIEIGGNHGQDDALLAGCSYGNYGDSCQFTCAENCLRPCDLKTGNCLFGCFDGWLGDRCDKACDVGKFGGQCLRTCSSNCLSSPCDHVTGKCKAGCMKGWEGFNCTDDCSEGNFGWNCSEKCDGCITNECRHINGVCKNISVCKPGYVYGKYCNQTCDAWHFGTNCNKMCNCLNKPCNTFTSKCPDGGCQKGWKGDSCDQECTHGYFGSNCIQFCDGCFDHSCNKLNGSCDRFCKEGFMGPLCATRDIAELKSLTELIKTNQKTLSDLNEKTIEIIEQQEEIDEDIKEVCRYELEIQIAITKIEKYSQRRKKIRNATWRKRQYQLRSKEKKEFQWK